jgi:hypothetical protein
VLFTKNRFALMWFSMTRYISALLLIFVIGGCGYNPEAPVYDTAENPAGFPDPALALLDNVESGELDSYDSITATFADLYTQHSELLDDERWKEVIDRLGVKFRYRADQAVESGLSGYSQAASLYLLASFARPEDTKAQRQAELFTAWSEGIRDSALAEAFDRPETDPSMRKKLELLRRFEFADTLHRSFSKQYLRNQLFGLSSGGDRIENVAAESLDVADSAFLSYVGLMDAHMTTSHASFADPSIDFVASRITPIKEDWYRLELYFVPRQKVTHDYAIAVRVTTSDTTLPEFAVGDLNFVPFDFQPQQATSQWPPSSVTAVAKNIYFTEPLSEVRIGLYRRGREASEFVPVDGSDDKLITIVASARDD